MKKIGLGTRPSEIKGRNREIDFDVSRADEPAERQQRARAAGARSDTGSRLSAARILTIVLASMGVGVVIAIALLSGFSFRANISAVRFATAGREIEVKNADTFIVKYADGLRLTRVVFSGIRGLFPPDDVKVEIAGLQDTINRYNENLIPLLKPEERIAYDVMVSRAGQDLGRVAFTLELGAQDWITRADAIEDKKIQIECYKKAVGINPDSDEAHIALGRLYEGEQKYRQAIPEYEAVIRIKPDNVQALKSLAALYKKTGEHLKVLDLYEKLSKADEAQADEYQYQAGLSAEKQGTDARAIELYQNALAKNKAHVDARQRLIKLYEKNRQWNRAVEHTKALLELNPKNADLYLYLSDIYVKQNNLKEALSATEQAQKLRPGDAAVYLQLAVLSEKTKNDDQAIEYYRKALKGNKKNAAVHNNLGLLLEKKGNTQEAIQYYEKAVSLNPKNPDFYRNLGDACEKSGNVKKAAEIYEKLLALDKKNRDALEALAILYYKAGSKEKSLGAYRDLAQLEPKKVLWHQKLAYLYEDLGKLDNARDEYKAVLAIEPSNAEAKQKYVELAKRKLKTRGK